MIVVYRGKELVEADFTEWSDEVVKNEISRFVLCSSIGRHPHQFYANKKDLKLAFNHYLDELER